MLSYVRRTKRFQNRKLTRNSVGHSSSAKKEIRSSAAYSNNAHIATVLIKARISAARRIPGICGERVNALICIVRKCVGSQPVFSSLQGGMDDFWDQGNLVIKMTIMRR